MSKVIPSASIQTIFVSIHYSTQLSYMFQPFRAFIEHKKVKVKVTLVQTLRLCTGRMAHRGNRGIGLPFLDHGTRKG